ncbi:hypothetical protein HRbin35_00353 [bacterium HR35]|nr:hypothetical protein HRbin35_00353 [bacterium HR35]
MFRTSFVKFLFEKAKNDFLEDYFCLYKNFIKLSELKRYINHIVFLLLDEIFAEKNFYKAIKFLNKFKNFDISEKADTELKLFIKRILFNNKIFNHIDNDKFSVVVVFVDSLKNKLSSYNFRNVLKACCNSTLTTSFLIIKFINNENIWRAKIRNLKQKEKIITLVNIKCKGNYDYSTFISVILTIINKLHFKNKEKKFLALIDDDCTIINNSSTNNHFDNLILELQCGKKLISGECIDGRANITNFHSFASFPYHKQTAILYEVPYCRGGGGGTLVNLMNLPSKIPNLILPGIYLNTYSFNNLSTQDILKIKETKSCEFIGTSKNNLVVHPVKDSLLSWSITRIKYKNSWNKAYSLMNPDKKRIYKQVKKIYLHKMIHNLLAYSTLDKNFLFLCIGYILIAFYYKKHLIRYNTYDFIKNFQRDLSQLRKQNYA